MDKNKIKNIVIVLLSIIIVGCIVGIIYLINTCNSLNKMTKMFSSDSMYPYDTVELLKDEGYTLESSALLDYKMIILKSADKKISFCKMYTSTDESLVPTLSFNNSSINDENYYLYGMPSSTEGKSQEEENQMTAYIDWLFDIGITENQLIAAIDYWESSNLYITN